MVQRYTTIIAAFLIASHLTIGDAHAAGASCEKEMKKAVTDCNSQDAKANSGENGQAGQSTQCSSQEGMNNSNSGLMSALAARCEKAITNCHQAAQKLRTEGKQDIANKKIPTGKAKIAKAQECDDTCSGDPKKMLTQLQGQGSGYGGNVGQSQKCKENAGGGGIPALPQLPSMPSMPEMPMPEMPKADCSNPAFAAQSPTCPKPQGAPDGTSLASTRGNLSPISGGGSSRSPSATGAPTPESSSGGKPSGGGSGGGGGDSSGLFGPSGNVAAMKKEILDPEKEKPNAASGAAAGGGGGGGFAGGGRTEPGIDLDQFAKKLSGKGVSGMTVKPIDGITGPLGASVFEKITKQYQLQKTNLVP